MKYVAFLLAFLASWQLLAQLADAHGTHAHLDPALAYAFAQGRTFGPGNWPLSMVPIDLPHNAYSQPMLANAHSVTRARRAVGLDRFSNRIWSGGGCAHALCDLRVRMRQALVRPSAASKILHPPTMQRDRHDVLVGPPVTAIKYTCVHGRPVCMGAGISPACDWLRGRHRLLLGA